jgi:L-rhamnose mutarotase
MTAALEKIAFRMILKPGAEAEYRRRHDAIWPELVALLREAGVRDYSIHLDPETHHLFAVLWRPLDHGMDALPTTEIMRRWWDAMADLMDVRPGNEPVVVPLETVFHLP